MNLIAALLLTLLPLAWDGAELIGEPLRDFELFDYERNIRSLYEHRGNPVLLIFWYPGDEHCEDALVAMEEVYQQYKADGLQVLALDIHGRTSDALFVIARNDLNYTFLEGIYDDALNDYKIEGVPSIFLLDPDMRAVKYFAGYDDTLQRRVSVAVDLLMQQINEHPEPQE